MRQSIVRWDPFRELVSIQDELNRLFGRTFGEGEEPLARAGSWVPAMDMYETGDKIVATIELPGIEPADVEVSVEDSTLTVTGRRVFSTEVKEENFHRVERRYGSFARTITLPQTADMDKVEARFGKGVLTVEVPKAERAKPKKIKVEAT